jgi:thioredoxin-like negative regulator of GroEL
MNVVHTCTQIHHEAQLNEVLTAHERVAVLFSATWCPFCIAFFPVFDRHCGVNEQVFPCVLIDDREILMDHYDVAVVPSVLYFVKGKLIKRLDGRLGVGLTESQLQNFMSSLG